MAAAEEHQHSEWARAETDLCELFASLAVALEHVFDKARRLLKVLPGDLAPEAYAQACAILCQIHLVRHLVADARTQLGCTTPDTAAGATGSRLYDTLDAAEVLRRIQLEPVGEVQYLKEALTELDERRLKFARWLYEHGQIGG